MTTLNNNMIHVSGRRRTKHVATHRHVSVLLSGNAFIRLSGFIARQYAGFNVRGGGVPKSNIISKCNGVRNHRIFICTCSFATCKKALDSAGTTGVMGIRALTLGGNTPIVTLGSSKNTHVRRKINDLTNCTSVFCRGAVTSKIIPRVSTVLNPYTNKTYCSPTLASFVFVIGRGDRVFVAKPSIIGTIARRAIRGRRLKNTCIRDDGDNIARFIYSARRRALVDVHRLLDFLPSGGVRSTPSLPYSSSVHHRARALRAIVPSSPGIPCSVGSIVRPIISGRCFFRIVSRFTGGIIINFTHLNNRSINVITGRPTFLTNILSVSTSSGTTHFVHFYSYFGVPLIAFRSMPNFLPNYRRRRSKVVHRKTGVICTCTRTAIPGVALVAHGTCNNTCVIVSDGPVNTSVGLTCPVTRVTIVKTRKTIGVLCQGTRKRRGTRTVGTCGRRFSGPCQTTRLKFVSRVVVPHRAHCGLVRTLRVTGGGDRDGPPGGRNGVPLWVGSISLGVVGGWRNRRGGRSARSVRLVEKELTYRDRPSCFYTHVW